MTANRESIRIGMVGGGPGSFIGESHRIGMRLDARYSLEAGVFSRDPERSRAFGGTLGLQPERLYADYATMAEAEAQRADRIEAVSIVTLNDTHYPIAKTFLEHGFAVICDKPLTPRLEDALDLYRMARAKQAIFAVTHNYSAYAMVRHAARMVRDGDLGTIRIVQVEHASGWAAAAVEHHAGQHVVWRTDPALAGAASAVYDVGTHAHHLLRYITGLEVLEVSAEMHTLVPGRRVFDNAHVALRLSNDAHGVLWASMAATGNEHGLRIRVFGDRASIEWRQEDPHHLAIRRLDASMEVLAQGTAGLAADAQRVTRVGLGHPEGYLEAFANLYSDVADAILAQRLGTPAGERDLSYPTVLDGVIGIRFVEAVIASHQADGRWTDATLPLDGL